MTYSDQEVRQVPLASNPQPRGPLDNKYVWGLVFRQRTHLLLAGEAILIASQLCTSMYRYLLSVLLVSGDCFAMPAGVALSLATFCNLASPVVTGILFEILTGGQAFSQYPKYLAVLGTLYIAEPLLTRVYINNACAAGEKASLTVQHFICNANLFCLHCLGLKCWITFSHCCSVCCATAVCPHV